MAEDFFDDTQTGTEFDDGQMVEDQIDQEPTGEGDGEEGDPIEVLRKEREASQQYRNEAEFYRTIAMQQMQQPAPVQQPTPEPGMFDGLTDDSEITVGNAKQAFQKFASTMESQFKKQITDLSEEIARSRYSDYDEVLKNHTSLAIQEKPALS